MSSNLAPSVFVVDDEPVIASTLAAILNGSGYSTTFFTFPTEALTAAQSKAPDLLISDVLMPGFSGIDLAIEMKTLCPRCKVLLFSGLVDTEDLLDGARSRGYDFELLHKPVHPSVVLVTIGDALGLKIYGLAPSADGIHLATCQRRSTESG